MEAMALKQSHPFPPANLSPTSVLFLKMKNQRTTTATSLGGSTAWRGSPTFPGISLHPTDDGSFFVMRVLGATSKWLLAKKMSNYEAIGFDLVASALNGIVVCGAAIDGCLAAACPLNRAARNGKVGNTVPSGMAVGGIAAGGIRVGKFDSVSAGDLLIALQTDAVHSNKFTDVLSLADEHLDSKLSRSGQSVGQALLARPRIYVSKVLRMISSGHVKAVAHITSNGLTDGISKLLLPYNLGASIAANSWPVPEVLKWLKKAGELGDEEMHKTFNMGIEMILLADAPSGYKILQLLPEAHVIGRVKADGGVTLV